MSSDLQISSEEFLKRYNFIKSCVVVGNKPQENKHAVILGGPPGVGKSQYYTVNAKLAGHVLINADELRVFHPHYEDIVANDLDNYPERTQAFVNQVAEKLIEDLSNEGYSLVVEGTMRNPYTPINTAELLMQKGYQVELHLIVGDAIESFKRTMLRAQMELDKGLAPRYVDIDKFDKIVSVLSHNTKFLVDYARTKEDISFTIINNDGGTEFRGDKVDYHIVARAMNVLDWNREYERLKIEFEKFKKQCCDSFREKQRTNHEDELERAQER